MSISKNGVWKGKEFSNYSYRTIISPQVIQEPDGSIWLQILHHNNPTAYKFASNNTFSIGVYLDTNRWAQFNFLTQTTKWELLVKQKPTNTGTEQKFRWIQTINPLTATFDETKAANVTFNTTTGYSTPESTYGGAYYNNNSSAYLVCNNGKNGDWFGAWGCWNTWKEGIPGYNSVAITSGYVDVFIRIDNDSLSTTDKAKIFNNQDTIGLEFIEN